MYLKCYIDIILVEAPPPEPPVLEVPAEEKVDDKKKEAAAAKNKKKGKTAEVEVAPVVSSISNLLIPTFTIICQ